MADDVRVEGGLQDFIKSLIGSFMSLKTIDNATLVEEGKLTDTNIAINETLLSDSKDAAIEEYKYIKARKTGDAISPKDEAKIKRLERDILKNKSKGFIYGN